MTEGTAHHGNVQIAYDTVGPDGGRPLLLVMGIGGQLLSWPDGFCQALVDRGFTVARFDNRDAGRSTGFADHGRPSQLRMLFRPASAAVYSLADLAGDALAVLDDLGWPAAHVVGVSQGGMIAQTLAVDHPDRVLSLTSISSTPAARLGQPSPGTFIKMMKVVNPKRVHNRDDFGQYQIDLQHFVGSPGYPPDDDRLRELGRRLYDRGGLDLAAIQRQTAAIAAAGDRRADLARIRVPTVVIHGEADPLIRPVAGRATADAIPGARYVAYPGMGHDLPAALWPEIGDEITAVAVGNSLQPLRDTRQ